MNEDTMISCLSCLSMFRLHVRRVARCGVAVWLGLTLGALPGRAANRPTRASSTGIASHAGASPWVATWGAGMVATNLGRVAPDVTGKTLRMVVHGSVGGTRVRIWLSNRFGTTPIHVGAAHVALDTVTGPNAHADPTTDLSRIQPGSDRALTFHHLGSVTVPPGATVVSDPVALDAPAFSTFAVSLYFPGVTMATTEHPGAQQISYAATGDVTGAAALPPDAWKERSWYFLTGVDVAAPGDAAVVAFGDSITDGAHATENENHRWPDYLAARLAADPAARAAGVLGMVNVGIGGNRVLLDGYGPNAVARIDPDLLARSGARYAIVLESINDIGVFANDHQPYGDLAQRLEAGLAQIVAQAHAQGIRVLGATLTPYGGCGYYSVDGEKVREAVNAWIRTSRTFDGVADFDKAVRDPKNPLCFAAQYDSGDHLHPKDAGYKAMADSIDLALLTAKN